MSLIAHQFNRHGKCHEVDDRSELSKLNVNHAHRIISVFQEAQEQNDSMQTKMRLHLTYMNFDEPF